MISIQNLSFSYNKQPVLHNFSWDIPSGTFVLLQGPSGCGKSTLLRLLAGLSVPCEGSVTHNGKTFAAENATLLRRRVAYMQQIPVMVEGSIRENVLLSFRYAPPGTLPLQDEKLRILLERLHLGNLSLDAEGEELSVGQKQRLTFLRLLLMKPDVFLLDEPVASLDRESAAVLMEQVTALHRDERKTIIFVSHAEHASVGEETRRFRLYRDHAEELR